GAADGDRIGELEVLDVGLADLVERREALGVVGAMVHQPVVWLLVGVDQPLRCHVGGERQPRGDGGDAGKQKLADAGGHGLPARFGFWLVNRRVGKGALLRAVPTRIFWVIEPRASAWARRTQSIPLRLLVRSSACAFAHPTNQRPVHSPNTNSMVWLRC